MEKQDEDDKAARRAFLMDPIQRTTRAASPGCRHCGVHDAWPSRRMRLAGPAMLQPRIPGLGRRGSLYPEHATYRGLIQLNVHGNNATLDIRRDLQVSNSMNGEESVAMRIARICSIDPHA